MIGDNIATGDLSSGTGDLPDATSHVTTLTKVNQDGYSSEYRFRGTDYDYRLLIRNSNENPRSDGVRFTRHNAEFTLTKRGDPEADPPTSDVPYICSFTARMPKGGDADVMKALAGHLANQIALYSSGANLQKMLNFES
jgi:hypothetical protein